MRNKFNPGDTFGRLTVVGKTGERVGTHATYLCKCVCGGTNIVQSGNLTSGNVRSCGCLVAETNAKRLTTHGANRTRRHGIWAKMLQRCKNQNATWYSRYGGRGITVCGEWDEFINFYNDMFEGYADDLELDRIDNNGNYCKENCRWTTRKENSRNRGNSRMVTFNGETRNLSAWSEILGVSYHVLYSRLYYSHWTVEEAFVIKPVKNRRKPKLLDGSVGVVVLATSPRNTFKRKQPI